MSPRRWQDRIEDIVEACEHAQSFVADVSYEEFAADVRTLHAATYELVVVGEAVRGLPDEVKERYPDVPWEKMLSVRNILVHEYFRVDPEILWGTIRENLPQVSRMLRAVLADRQASD
jgi:uncharacterized protein with HEPN domain